MPPRLHIILRLIWDFLINAVARAIICGTAPIMLCVEGPLDFVKDATAVFFIIKLDDIEDTAYLNEWETWCPLLLESHYEVSVANDHAYKINGLRKLLQFPSVQDVKSEWEVCDEKKRLEADRRKSSTDNEYSAPPAPAVSEEEVEPAS